MMGRRRLKYKLQIQVLGLFILLGSGSLWAQKKVLTVGIQYKPIFPSRFFNGGPLEIELGDLNAVATQRYGHNIGLPIRFGITNWFSAETGISFIQRNYRLNYTFENDTTNHAEESSLKVVSYQIPIKAMFFIRLSERIYMNTAVGAAMILFPSDVEKRIEINGRENFLLEGRRGKNGWFQGAFIADLGAEYRMDRKGIIYLGASYHLPFSHIMDIAMGYQNEGDFLVGAGKLGGSFLTLDVRYYFPEKELNRKKKKKK